MQVFCGYFFENIKYCNGLVLKSNVKYLQCGVLIGVKLFDFDIGIGGIVEHV